MLRKVLLTILYLPLWVGMDLAAGAAVGSKPGLIGLAQLVFYVSDQLMTVFPSNVVAAIGIGWGRHF